MVKVIDRRRILGYLGAAGYMTAISRPGELLEQLHEEDGQPLIYKRDEMMLRKMLDEAAMRGDEILSEISPSHKDILFTHFYHNRDSTIITVIPNPYADCSLDI